ncbi:MAG: Glutamine synthetase, partial [Pseudomonadota bacterium]
YLYMAAQIHAGLSGVEQALNPPLATESPYAADGDPELRIPTNLRDALETLSADTAMTQGLGADFIRYYSALKLPEQQRFESAEDPVEFQRREYFSRL